MFRASSYLLLLTITVCCVPLPTQAQYDSQGRRIIKPDRNGNLSAADQAFMANMKAQAEARQPCASGPPKQAIDKSQIAVARNLIAQGNSTAAYHILFPLSHAGDPDADYLVGKILLTVPNPEFKDVAGGAVVCLRLAAEQGNIPAKTAWGVALKHNFGAPAYPMVFNIFQDAANHGDAEAEYNLGLMYAEGQGVAKNEALSREWLQKASAAGYSEANQYLAQLHAGPITESEKAQFRQNFRSKCAASINRSNAARSAFFQRGIDEECRCQDNFLVDHITKADYVAYDKGKATDHFKQILHEGVEQCRSPLFK